MARAPVRGRRQPKLVARYDRPADTLGRTRIDDSAANGLSPDKRFELRVFSAGQSSIPRDYRADVRFVLRRHDGWFWYRDTLVASAALADGWSVKWTTARTIGIEAGPFSFFSFMAKRAGEVAVSVHVASRSPEEARCIGQTLTNAINGVFCFDALLAATQAGVPAKP